ncbi:hypothetical protein M8C21_012345, partial [Ambrosia artemisiifolia]
PVECVSVCRFSKGDGSGRYDCSVVSCAWKAPRALTGLLATTAHPCSDEDISEVLTLSVRKTSVLSNFFPPRKLLRSSLLHIGCRKWVVACSSSSPSGYDELSPEILWEVRHIVAMLEDLKPSIAYLTSNELEIVHDALKLAFEAHDGQKRRSGEPFIIHPVEVARILGELELDWESIAAGLLHDTVEDTNVVTFERIEKEFGVTVRHIVEGETKVSKLGKLKCNSEISSVQDVKAHDLRQMFLAMTEEVRVIIVKLADRLHNMRTLSHMPVHKQSSIAMETLQVFAPLAKLLGMYQIKSELENLSFMYTNPQDYGKIKRRVAELYKDHEKEIEEANRLLIKKIEDDQFLNLMALTTEVQSVCKEPYSIYKSVLKSGSSINEVNQIAQLRIIVKPKPCVGVAPLCNAQQICYHVLGLVHGFWTPIPRAVNGNLVPPLHVLANAEVVEIVTYNGLSSKSAFQRHKQWLQHAKTRSARHKIMKFLREQAALSASEITADSVNEFIADTEDDSEAEDVLDYSKGTQHTWETILMNVMEMSSSKMVDEDLFRFKNGSIKVSKVNGKHNKHMQHVSLKTNSHGNEFGKLMQANVPMYKEVLPSLESWLDGKVSSWSKLQGHSIQWLCIACIDRKGMMADITLALADAGISICSCAAEVDRGRGMAVILFHVEASLDNLVSACSRVDIVLGVLGWSTGCSWPSLGENQHIREC